MQSIRKFGAAYNNRWGNYVSMFDVTEKTYGKIQVQARETN